VIVCSTLDGECEEVMVEAGHTPLAGTEIMQVPIETADGTIMTDAIVVDNEAEADYYGVLDTPTATATQEVLICNALNGECSEVTVEAGHTGIEGTEFMQIPVETEEGVVMRDAIVVDTVEEAQYYGVHDEPAAPAAPVEEEEY